MKRNILLVVVGVVGFGTAACSGGGEEAAPTALPTLAVEEATAVPVTEPTEAPSEYANAPEGPAAAALASALAAAEAEDWDKARTELTEAADLASDPQQKQAVDEILADLDKGDFDEVLEDLEKMVSGGTGESLVMGYLDEALDAGKAGDWDKAAEELNEALDAATDPQQKQAIEEIIADLDKGDHDEVLEDLEKLIG
ncbi:MAG: hypothetical protein ACE5EL_04995 [Anaerolineae bacterium]